jgi:hypothetical protein
LIVARLLTARTSSLSCKAPQILGESSIAFKSLPGWTPPNVITQFKGNFFGQIHLTPLDHSEALVNRQARYQTRGSAGRLKQLKHQFCRTFFIRHRMVG